MVWVAVNRITVDAPNEADRLVEAFGRRPKKVDQRPGFRGLEVWREDQGREVMVVTRWERKEDFLSWVESPSFREAHKGAAGSPGEAHGAVYEVVP